MSWLLGRKEDSIFAVIDIHSTSISAAYVHAVAGKAPVIVASVEYPLDTHATEPLGEAVARVLEVALTALVKNGSPTLRSYAGSARVDKVLIAMGAPWHTHTVVARDRKEKKPFQVSQSLIEELLEDDAESAAQTMTNQKVISVYLNGYETPDPFGKKATSIEVIALNSRVDAEFYKSIRSVVTSAFHSKNIWITSFITEFYFSYRQLFPHQRDYILLDVGHVASDIICVKHSLLVWSTSASLGTDTTVSALRETGIASKELSGLDTYALAPQWKDTFTAALQAELSALSQEEALPNLVLYHAAEDTCAFLREVLADERLFPLWLSSNPPTAHPVSKSEFSKFVSALDGVNASIPLYVLALSGSRG